MKFVSPVNSAWTHECDEKGLKSQIYMAIIHKQWNLSPWNVCCGREREKKNRIQTNTYKRINFIKCHIKWYNLCHNLFTWRVVSGRSMMVNPWGDIHLLLTTRHRELWYKLCHFVAPTTSITQFHHTSNYDEWKLWNFRGKKASKQVRVQMLVSNWTLSTYLSNEIYVFAKM